MAPPSPTTGNLPHAAEQKWKEEARRRQLQEGEEVGVKKEEEEVGGRAAGTRELVLPRYTLSLHLAPNIIAWRQHARSRNTTAHVFARGEYPHHSAATPHCSSGSSSRKEEAAGGRERERERRGRTGFSSRRKETTFRRTIVVTDHSWRADRRSALLHVGGVYEGAEIFFFSAHSDYLGGVIMWFIGLQSHRWLQRQLVF